MISAAYARQMARYNQWQNAQLFESLAKLPAEALTQDRGAFFGSIMGTLSHLWWGDGLWMSRFDGGEAPGGGIPHSTDLFTALDEWRTARMTMDARIATWASTLADSDLEGDLTWYSGAAGKEITKPRASLVMQMFNHQTHHRGQVHKMITETGAKAPVTDIPFMPESI